MKKFLLLFLCCISFLSAAEINAPILLKLLDTLHIPHDGTREGIVSATQKYWYQPGKERWEFDYRFEEKKEECLPLLDELGCMQELTPHETDYDYALLLGATSWRVQDRLNFLVELWNKGIRFHTLVFLTGKRDLLKEEMPGGAFESEMMLQIYQNTAIPDDMRQVPLVIIDSPKRNGRRPTTFDTVFDWMAENPLPGKCLAISNQPYAVYQDSVLRKLLPGSFTLETVGPGSTSKERLSLYLDNVARWVYEEWK